LKEIDVNLSFRTQRGSDAGERFGVRIPLLDGITGVDGAGAIAPQSTGKATWILVPTLDAAPEEPTLYFIGGILSYTQNGTRVRIPLADVPITVHPGPELLVDYFHQRDVFSDDPFTMDEVEPAIPYALGMMIRNVGRGEAKNFRITSGQPTIEENEKGLLIDFKLIGAEVFGQNLAPALTPSLTSNFGNIGAGTNVIGQWFFTSSLQGLFIDYKATFEHLDGIAGRRLSIITNVAIHEMIRTVAASGPFADGRPDFLLNEVRDLDDLPDTVWLSDGTTQPVAVVQESGSASGPPASGGDVELTLSAPAGFVYARIPDPAGTSERLGLRLLSIRRSDGVFLPSENFWQTDRTFLGRGNRPRRENRVHLFDRDSTGRYTLSYAPVEATDVQPPSSAVGSLPTDSGADIPVRWSGSDDRPGPLRFDVFVSDNEGPFQAWLRNSPLLAAIYPGVSGHRYAFYSVAIDAAGNREAQPAAPDATTATTLVNTVPHLAAVPDQVVVEGAEIRLELGATDPDPGQTLTFALGADAPPGISLAGSLLRWPTGEGNGPSTNEFSVSVRDDGVPALTDTTRIRVVVLETNSPPVLTPIDDAVVRERQVLSFEITASDSDRPLNRLRYALEPGAPVGATLDASTGTFRWTPNETQGGKTYPFTVRVSDNGIPPLTASNSFHVVVRDTQGDFRLTLGSTNVMAGKPQTVPVRLQTGVGLNRLEFWLDSPSDSLTGLQLIPLAREIESAVLQGDGASYRASLNFTTGSLVSADESIAELRFGTAGLESVVAPLLPSGLTAVDFLGETRRGAAVNGRVIIVAQDPVLILDNSSEPEIVLFGLPGRRYQLESAEDLSPDSTWDILEPHTLEGEFQSILMVPVTDATRFYRCREVR